MGIKVPTKNEIVDAFWAAFMSIPKAQETRSQAEFNRLFRGLLDQTWQQIVTGLETISCPNGERLFRVATKFTLEKHKDGQLDAAEHKFRSLSDEVAKLAEESNAVTLYFHPIIEVQVSVGTEFTLKVQGVS